MSPLTKYLLRNILSKPFLSGLIVLSLAVVAASISAITAVGFGLRHAFSFKGHDNWVMTTARGAKTESESTLPVASLGAITVAPEVKRHSAEAVSAISVVKDGVVNIVQVRGLDPEGWQLHEMRLLAGRVPNAGEQEVMVGDTLREFIPSLTIGSSVSLFGVPFTCVGIFHAAGFFSGEVWTTRATFKADPRRNGLSVVYLETPSAHDARMLEDRLNAARDITVSAKSESEFYARVIGSFEYLTRGLTIVFLLIVTGSFFAAASLLNLLHHRRLFELYSMRAIGFRASRIGGLLLYETQLLVACGGVLGIGATALALRNYVLYTVSGERESVVFRAPLTMSMVLLVAVVLLLIGIVGAASPIVRMARTSVSSGLREE